jgi:hypothetical protein
VGVSIYFIFNMRILTVLLAAFVSADQGLK